MTSVKKAGAATMRIRTPVLVTWSLVAMVSSMMMIPLNALIPAFYAEHTATSLAAIGGVLFVARLYDAVADPAVGYLSDLTHGPWGARKPWLLAGGALAAVSAWLLYNPAPTAGVAYFLPVMLAFYTAYTLLTVPHSAWGAELSRAAADRTRISGALTFAGVAGLLLFSGLPLLLSSPLAPLFRTAEITPPMLRLLGALMAIVTPVAVLAAVMFTPRGEPVVSPHAGLGAAVTAVRGNRPFLGFMVAYLLTGLGYGVYYGSSYLFLDAWLGLAPQFPLIYGAVAVAQMVSIPLWVRLLARFERHRMWALGLLVWALLLPVQLLLPRGGHGLMFMLPLVILSSFANAASQAPQMAVMADCIDYDQLRTGSSRAGAYYAIQAFTLKATLAAGGGLSFLLLSLARFDAKTKIHDARSLDALATIHVLLPLLLFTGAGALLWRFPLHRRRQDVIRRALDVRAARRPLATAPPLT